MAIREYRADGALSPQLKEVAGSFLAGLIEFRRATPVANFDSIAREQGRRVLASGYCGASIDPAMIDMLIMTVLEIADTVARQELS